MHFASMIASPQGAAIRQCALRLCQYDLRQEQSGYRLRAQRARMSRIVRLGRRLETF
jgi:hypothetical protein